MCAHRAGGVRSEHLELRKAGVRRREAGSQIFFNRKISVTAHTDLFVPCTIHIFELPPNSVEGTEFQVATERGEEAPRLAVRTEKRANKNVKIRLLFS